MHPKTFRKFLTLMLCLLTGIVLTACGGGGSSDSGSGGGTGTLSTSLTDNPTDDYQAVFVTIDHVEAHAEGDEGAWINVTPDMTPTTYNLMDLVGIRESLGLVDLPTGHYTQIRLIITETKTLPHPYANYVIDENGAVHPLTMTSETKTGLKLITSFYIIGNQTTELIIDFDASRSVVKAGNSGKYLLKPTVKVINTAEYAIVEGKVTDNVTPTSAAMPGALVSAQAADTVEAGTITDGNGDYTLFLAPGNYNLVATNEDYLPGCVAVVLDQDQKLNNVNFNLSGEDWVSITVNVSELPADQYVTIDFRKLVSCTDQVSQQWITVKTVNFGEGSYTVTLPAGAYSIIASVIGKTTMQKENFNVAQDSILDFPFQ